MILRDSCHHQDAFSDSQSTKRGVAGKEVFSIRLLFDSQLAKQDDPARDSRDQGLLSQ